MNKLLVLITAIFAFAGVAHADPSHDVLAHSSGDWAWFAHVTKSTVNSAIEAPDSSEQTELFARHTGPGEQWKTLPTLTGRAVVLAGRMSQLAVLMKDHQWLTVWADGSAGGQPLPADGQIKTIADDGNDLWAIGSVNGGIAAANEALLIERASTIPTTSPMLAFPTTAHANAGLPPNLVLFREVNGRWAAIAELPIEQVAPSDDDLSLAVIGGTPMLSFHSPDGGIHTLSYAADHTWQSVGAIKPATTQPIQNFRLLNDGSGSMLWITTGNSPGEIFSTGSDSQDSPSIAKPLKWLGPAQLDGIPTATFAGGYICVFGPSGDKVLEQRYKISGDPFETAAELSAPEPGEGLLPHWLEAVLLAFMGFSVGANVFRQWSAGDHSLDTAETLAPAPLLPRFIAGLIDALPMVGAVAFVLVQVNGSVSQNDLLTSKCLIILGSALAVYLLHTTLAEVLTGRSAGKWLLGLKVVTLEGQTPAQSQYLIRNLLRIVDPLVMIIFSPLRQRSADTVANTMVVRIDAKPMGTSAEDLKESDANQSDSH